MSIILCDGRKVDHVDEYNKRWTKPCNEEIAIMLSTQILPWNQWDIHASQCVFLCERKRLSLISCSYSKLKTFLLFAFFNFLWRILLVIWLLICWRDVNIRIIYYLVFRSLFILSFLLIRSKNSYIYFLFKRLQISTIIKCYKITTDAEDL